MPAVLRVDLMVVFLLPQLMSASFGPRLATKVLFPLLHIVFKGRSAGTGLIVMGGGKNPRLPRRPPCLS